MRDVGSAQSIYAAILVQMRRNRIPVDSKLLHDAFEACLIAHDGQKRASGEPYSTHPLAFSFACSIASFRASARKKSIEQ
jgi:(p)ppGpp synthase/HD superfamily hydrolase